METSFIVTTGECYWHLGGGGGQGCCATSDSAWDSPTTKDYPFPNVNSAKGEKPWGSYAQETFQDILLSKKKAEQHTQHDITDAKNKKQKQPCPSVWLCHH